MSQPQTARGDTTVRYVSSDDGRLSLWSLVVSVVCIVGAAVIMIGLAFHR